MDSVVRTEFSVAAASCPGAIYEIHVLSEDGGALDFLGARLDPSNGTTSGSQASAEVVATFPGDANHATFAAEFLLGPTFVAGCVRTFVVIRVASQVLATGPAAGSVEVCANGSAGEVTYFE